MNTYTEQIYKIYKTNKKQTITLPELLEKLKEKDSSITIKDLSYLLWDTYS